MKELNIQSVKITPYIIEGYENDYVFETIKKTNSFYEIDILKKWTPYFKDSKVILDVGANLGNHSLFWAKEISNCKIYSFEPYLPTFERLLNNVKLNGADKIEAINKGIGKSHSFAHVKFVDEKNMGSTTLEYDEGDGKGCIEIIDIDSFSAEHKLDSIDFVKIDTEGFETDVLNGMHHTLKTMSPDIWVEVSKDTFLVVDEILNSNDYTLIDIEGFNMLYLSRKRHNNLSGIDNKMIMDKMFYYLKRTNDYYGLYNAMKEKNQLALEHYNTAKQWNENNITKLDALGKEYKVLEKEYEELKSRWDKQKDDYEKQQDNYNILQNNYNNLENNYNNLENNYNDLKKNYSGLEENYKKENENFINELKATYKEYLVEESILQDVISGIRELELRNRQLEDEVNSYKQKINRIKSTWYGKVLFKGYSLLKKIKSRLAR